MSGTGGASVVTVAAAVVATAAVALFAGARPAGYLLAAVLLGVAIARAVLPVRVVGPFAVRSRAVDVAVCGALAVALAAITHLAPL